MTYSKICHKILESCYISARLPAYLNQLEGTNLIEGDDGMCGVLA
jgi:hypothetical protein